MLPTTLRTALRPLRTLIQARMSSTDTSIEALLKQFRDPHSPFHLPPGVRGPADESDVIPSYTIPRPAAGGDLATPAHDPSAPVKTDRPLPSWLPSPDYTESRRSVLEEIKKGNFDISRSIEWPIAWGDVDKFNHVNNVHYLGFFETARLSFVQSLPPPINPSVVTAMLQGRGVGFVVKSHNIVYKSPVHHPDSLVIACRPHTISPVESPSSFSIAMAAYSLKTGKLAATCNTVLVSYDHERGAKAPISPDLKASLESCIVPSPPTSEESSKL